MLITRPLPKRPGGTPLLHVLEVVERFDGGRELAPVSDFLGQLSDPQLQDMYARFERLELEGAAFFDLPQWHGFGNWFKHLRNVGDMWELGDNNRVRFYGFREGSCLLLTNGSEKRAKKTPMGDLERCRNIRDRFKKEGRRG